MHFNCNSTAAWLNTMEVCNDLQVCCCCCCCCCHCRCCCCRYDVVADVFVVGTVAANTGAVLVLHQTGAQRDQSTLPVWPVRVWRTRPEEMSHMRRAWSPPAASKWRCSAVKLTSSTVSSIPCTKHALLLCLLHCLGINSCTFRL